MRRSSEHAVLEVKLDLFELELQFWRKCFLLTCAASAGVSAYLCGAEVLPPSPRSSDLFSTSSLLEMFHSHSLLTANLILTCLRIMQMLAEPRFRGLLCFGIMAVLKVKQ